VNEPYWLTGAAVAAALAGLAPAQAAVGLPPDAAAALERVMTALPRDAGPVADARGLRTVGAEACRLPARDTAAGVAERAAGASLLAAALAALPRSERAGLARTLDAESLRLATQIGAAGAAPRDVRAVIGVAAFRLGRMPGAGELGEVACALRGGAPAPTALAVATLRSLRARGLAVGEPVPGSEPRS
jgi:hypothetical protein